jgi:hypothetical protein
VREVDSHINREGAGSDCTPLDGETVESCWGAGPYPADLVPSTGEDGTSRVLGNAGNVLVNNLFLNADALWGPATQSPYNHPNGSHSFGFVSVDHNYWYNGGAPLEDPNDGSWLVEGPSSVYTGAEANPDPALGSSVEAIDVASPTLLAELALALRPTSDSPLIGRGSADARGFAAVDFAAAARPAPPSIGALEPALP